MKVDGRNPVCNAGWVHPLNFNKGEKLIEIVEKEELKFTKSVQANLYLATTLVLNDWAQKDNLSLALMKIRALETSLLDLLDSPNYTKKNWLMERLRAVQDFKQHYRFE